MVGCLSRESSSRRLLRLDHVRIEPVHESRDFKRRRKLFFGLVYRSAQNDVQNIVEKDLGRARQSSEGTAGTNLTKPGAHYLVNL